MPEKENMAKRPLNVGLLAHVDAGKTTLSEALMYVSGWIFPWRPSAPCRCHLQVKRA